MRSLLLAIPLLASSIAAAEPVYDMGARIGGYGFRREGDNSDQGWTECQMGGIGIFGSRAVAGPVFVEAAIDAYTSRNEVPEGDLPISRMSGLATIAGGARTSFTSWLRGYVQVGGGVELTRVSVPYGEETIRDTKAMPMGFVGVGAEFRVGKKTYFGMNVRTNAMGNFNYKKEDLEMKQDWGFTMPSSGEVFDESLGFSAQGQFFVRRDL